MRRPAAFLVDSRGCRQPGIAAPISGRGFHEDGLQSGPRGRRDLGGLRRPWDMLEGSTSIHLIQSRHRWARGMTARRSTSGRRDPPTAAAAMHQLRYRIFRFCSTSTSWIASTRSLRFSRTTASISCLPRSRLWRWVSEALRAQIERLAAPPASRTRWRDRAAGDAACAGVRLQPSQLYFCRAGDGALMALLYEVTNTYGERHAYFMPVTGDRHRRADRNARSASTFRPSYR